MNRKLHNTVTALFATTGLLVLGLMAANPVAQVPSPFAPQAEVASAAAAKTRYQQDAAKRIEARAAEMEARLAKTKDKSQALGEIAGFAAEAATLAAIAAAFDQADALDATPVAEIAKPHRTHGRQSVAMPFFSFAPRG